MRTKRCTDCGEEYPVRVGIRPKAALTVHRRDWCAALATPETPHLAEPARVGSTCEIHGILCRGQSDTRVDSFYRDSGGVQHQVRYGCYPCASRFHSAERYVGSVTDLQTGKVLFETNS